ncbi:prepilin-type N-terminal cleavage/methylation domain-containing protein [uncultured Brachybacterium sp.]|uniref:prepilin-type N-terminal cleavage/methylation domain-containing protein n=1 Tax=uncultured Brachybacterium sp. TaxID=189680 RepID=UPI00263284EF|nr:prepilin-type N-terminal cleavage/methylation domain-containing protein [uncultured Brachybacterium sp.]
MNNAAKLRIVDSNMQTLSLAGQARKRNFGFTIVELLIVIVVIAILVAISIVSYIGIQNSANEAALKSDLRNASTQLEVERSGLPHDQVSHDLWR